LDLQERAHTLALLSELGYNNPKIVQKASVPSSPSSPKTKRNTILGAFLGLVLGLALGFLLERFDRRIREPEALEEIYGLPMLGVVPESAALSQSTRQEEGKGTALPPAESEAFSLIRAHLRFFNVDQDLHTVLVASPAPGDGKTTIARHLAEAAARSGARALLLEADLRHPMLAGQLNVQSNPGLTDVLIGAIRIDEAIQSVGLPLLPSGEEQEERTLYVLAAGATPPNPGELLESQAMDAVLAQVKSTYDFVVIDTPPLTAVSDAFSLLSKADGVVIVGRVGHSRRDAAERLHQDLASAGAPLLGVIANGSKLVGPKSYFTNGKSPSIASSADGDDALAPITKT
jgi:polysaccharide biosynthesis transport protein